MTHLDSTAQSTTLLTRVSGQNQFSSAGVLLGTIATAGAVGLSVVVAIAPTTEALLLIGALGLPWALLAVAASLSLMSTPAQPCVAKVHASAQRVARVPAPALRLTVATAAIALLLLASVVAHKAVTDTSADATTARTGTTAQVAAAD